MSASQANVGQLAQDVNGSRTPTDVANAGFSGGGSDIPYRSEMEQSFGRSFEGVSAHFGAPARKANDDLGSNAYAMGSSVAFKTDNPSKALVAHELTHVVQQSEDGPRGKNADGIDTSGEAEAEAVEAAVAAGKPATSVLGAPSSTGAGVAASPALKARDGKGPALDRGDVGMGTQFSKDGLQKSGEYTIIDWSMPPAPFPAPMFTPIPGVFWRMNAAVKVKASAGVDWGGENAGSLSISLAVEAGGNGGLEGGIPSVCVIFGEMGPSASAEATFRTDGSENWSLDIGAIAVKFGGVVGLEVGEGPIGATFQYQLFELELLKIRGFSWNQDGNNSSIALEAGADLEDIVTFLSTALERARQIGEGIGAAASAVGSAVSDGLSWVGSWFGGDDDE